MRAIVSVSLLVVLGCSSPPAEPERANREGVRLIDAGEEPRRVLAYAIDDGLEQTHVECEIRASAGDDERTTRFSLALETSTRAIAGRELFDERIRIVEASADPDEDPQQARALRALVGATYAARVGANGWYEERTLPEVEGADPVVTASRDALAEIVLGATPLPSDPVGVGARWEAVASQGGAEPGGASREPGVRRGARLRTRYELVSFEGEHAVRLRVRIRQDGEAETRTEGRAEVVVDLRRAHPDGEAVHDRVRTVPVEGGRTLEVRQRVTVRVSPR